MKNRNGFTVIELIVVVVLLAIVAAVLGLLATPGRLVGGINSTYSQSTRIGKIIKFGEKSNFYGGYKSWEGAMQISDFGLRSSNIPDSTVSGNIWEFSLEPTAERELTDKILLALKEQRPISLTYRQWWSRPATIATEYVIIAAEFPEEVSKPKK